MAVMAAMLLFCSGCGTLFFSHRIGREASTVIDKRVFITNCILCLLVVPGVVAFVLDYDNGTIYYTEAELLPEDLYGMKKIPCKEMRAEEIAQQLSRALGKNVTPGEIHTALARAKGEVLL